MAHEEFITSGAPPQRNKSEIVPAGGIVNGQKTVASAGTAVALASNTAIRSVTVRALIGNTGDIFVGNSGVTSANGHPLSQGENVSLDIDNLDKVFIDAATSSDGVSFIGVV